MYLCWLDLRLLRNILLGALAFHRIHFEPELHQLGHEHLGVLRIRDVLRLLEHPQPTPARGVQNVLQLLLL